MTDNDTWRYEMFLRVRQHGTNEAASLASNTFVTSLFNDLSQLITELETYAGAQSSGLTSARQSTRSIGVARDELERDLQAISRTARAMALSTPGLEEKFRLRSRLKDQDLLTFARRVASEALPLKAEFVKRGLDENFLEDLNEDIEAFEEALAQRTQDTATHINATTTIDDLIERGMRIVRELDAIMRNIYEDNPGKLAAWLSASRVERPPRRRPQPPAPPAP
ncbi:MAG TPA: hypothetical protein VF544_15125 [Pyrinomonadaceae bacterium]